MNSFLKISDITLCQKFSEIQVVSFGMIWQREMINTSDAIYLIEQAEF